MNWLLLLYLLINAWTDSRKKIIDLRITAGYLLVLGFLVIWGGYEWSVMGMLPGMLICIISKFRREKIGSGDGILLIAVGITLDFEKTCSVLMNGCLLVCVWWMMRSVLLGDRRKEFPFVPFLLIGYGIEVYLQ